MNPKTESHAPKKELMTYVSVLFGHRKETYKGEYAPEALAVADALTMDSNPEFLASEMQDRKENGEFSSLAVVRINISADSIMKALYPESVVINGEVQA